MHVGFRFALTDLQRLERIQCMSMFSTHLSPLGDLWMYKESGFGDPSYKEQTRKESHNVNQSIENGIS